VIVNYSTNINKTNNQLSPEIIEQLTVTYEFGNIGPVLGTGTKWLGVKAFMGSPPSPPDYLFSNGNTNVYKRVLSSVAK